MFFPVALILFAQLRATLPDPAADALVAKALANTPEVASARASAEAAKLRIVPLSTLPDPFISTSYQNEGRSLSLGSQQGSFIGLMLSQTFPWRGKLRLAGQAAEKEAQAIESGAVGRAALTIEARVRNAFYDLALARTVDKIVDERQTAAQQIEQTVRQRYAAGLGVQQDVLRAQVELARVGELKAAQQAAIVARSAELQRLAGAAGDATVPAIAPVPPANDLVAATIARSPEAAAAQANIESSQIAVAAARKNFYPDLTVTAGSMYRGNFEMGPMGTVGVGFSVPLWIEKRQQNLVAAAEATVHARTADRESIARDLDVRTRERVAQLAAANDIAAIYRDKILPLDQVSLDSALASYEAGKVPFITVLDALNTVYSDRVTYASRLAEAAKWRVAIDEASLQPTAMGGGASMSASSTSMTTSTPAAASPSSGTATTAMR